MAATKVQTKSYRSTAQATSHNISPTSTPTSGNLLILTVVSDATVNTPSGWTLAVSAVNYSGTYIYYKTSAGNETTITVSPTASAATGIDFLEYSGMATSSQLDATASTTPPGTVSSVSSGTTATTAQADEVLVAVIGISTTLQSVSPWSNSFTEEFDSPTTGAGVNVQQATATRIVAATAAYETTGTLSGSTPNPSGAIATFKVAATGGGTFAFLVRTLLGVGR